ncbi:hypothetical protein NDU88_001022 [Pleurodeles waltl]|uniref:Uncharacterized protein n=1 Tax=Pleurodeles waltl TaxID=8319 RepID=A0AAV7TGF8_PLEWA|nr:hypothetical protein NDU88_001022 [Pleurodeles waltl]
MGVPAPTAAAGHSPALKYYFLVQGLFPCYTPKLLPVPGQPLVNRGGGASEEFERRADNNIRGRLPE